MYMFLQDRGDDAFLQHPFFPLIYVNCELMAVLVNGGVVSYCPLHGSEFEVAILLNCLP